MNSFMLGYIIKNKSNGELFQIDVTDKVVESKENSNDNLILYHSLTNKFCIYVDTPTYICDNFDMFITGKDLKHNSMPFCENEYKNKYGISIQDKINNYLKEWERNQEVKQ